MIPRSKIPHLPVREPAGRAAPAHADASRRVSFARPGRVPSATLQDLGHAPSPGVAGAGLGWLAGAPVRRGP